MGKLTKAIFISAFALTLATFGFTQAAGPNGGGVTGQTNPKAQGKDRAVLRGGQKLEQEVLAKINPALSPEQKEKIDQLNKRTVAATKELREKAQTGDKTALREEVQKLQANRIQALRQILSPAQQRSYMQLMQEAREKMRDGKKGKAGKDGKAKTGNGKGG